MKKRKGEGKISIHIFRLGCPMASSSRGGKGKKKGALSSSSFTDGWTIESSQKKGPILKKENIEAAIRLPSPQLTQIRKVFAQSEELADKTTNSNWLSAITPGGRKGKKRFPVRL